jgi:hypothetical protein
MLRGFPGDAASWLTPEKGAGQGVWDVHNTCLEQTIHGHWTSFGPCSNYCKGQRIDSGSLKNWCWRTAH